MYPGRAFIPQGFNPMMNNPMQNAIRPGLFGRIGNTIKGINWSKILSGADKTLGVVNQTIPLVRQTKPLFSNMKSMIKLAKAFREEVKPTSTSKNSNTNLKNTDRTSSNNSLNNNSKLKQEIKKEKTENIVIDNSLNNTPSFFV